MAEQERMGIMPPKKENVTEEIPEKTSWKLSEEELATLRDHQSKKEGFRAMLDALATAMAYNAEAERTWWVRINKAHKIPDKYRHSLLADGATGIVKVKERLEDI